MPKNVPEVGNVVMITCTKGDGELCTGDICERIVVGVKNRDKDNCELYVNWDDSNHPEASFKFDLKSETWILQGYGGNQHCIFKTIKNLYVIALNPSS